MVQLASDEFASLARQMSQMAESVMGRQMFGFSPTDAVQAHRNSQSAYIDVESHPLEALDVDVAGRFENYSDFGTTVNGKIAARYDFSEMFALRGAIALSTRSANSPIISFMIEPRPLLAPPTASTGIFSLPPLRSES